MSGERPSHGRGSLDLWGGHFAHGPAPLMEQINASIGFDKRLYAHDIAGSAAHARMLHAVGLLEDDEHEAIQSGLSRISEEIGTGKFRFRTDLEDIHMNVEAQLIELIGEPGRRLHTARSRNDQVATDLRLWTRDAIAQSLDLLRTLQGALIEVADDHADAIMPGFTHLQAAQPVTLGHHLLAYVEMFGRDRGRFEDASARLDECPLGAAALAGTSFPIDREMTAQALGFSRPMANSIDAVADRDFAVEFLSAASVAAVHLSRLAEELVLWSTPQFAFVRIAEEFTSGSSIMPQKRNPDAAELIRGKTGRIVGALNALILVLKGLPLAYSKDMQEDKEPLFDAADALHLCLAAMAEMIRSARFDRERLRAAAGVGHVTATDLADWLVRSLRLPFRQAHGIAARAVAFAESRGCALAELPIEDFRQLEPRISADVYDVLTVERSVASRRSQGGTAPEQVRRAIREAKERFL